MKKLAWLAIVLLGACSKSKNLTPPDPGSARIKTISSGASQSEYLYHADGNLWKIIRNGLTEYEYSYTPGKATSFRYKTDGSLLEKVNMTLNAEGLVSEYLNEAYPNTLIKYEYNADRTVKTKKNYDNGNLSTITVYVYKDKNLIKDSTYSAGGAPNYSRTYDYYTDVSSTTEFPHFGQAFWGPGNRNALKKVTYFNDANGAVTGTQDFGQPQTDAAGRVYKTSYQSNGAGTPVERTYLYY